MQSTTAASLREQTILEEPDTRESLDICLDDLDPRIVEALLSLNRAIGMGDCVGVGRANVASQFYSGMQMLLLANTAFPHSTESVTEIEFELDEVKGHYREVIRVGVYALPSLCY